MTGTDEIWPEELDAVIASSKHHKLLFENEFVRVLEVRILPGETTDVHTHQWPGTVYIKSWSDFVRRDDKGNILLESKNVIVPESKAYWVESLGPHSLENIGENEICNICVEIKKTV